jgi:CheY-like chemotaxis protein
MNFSKSINGYNPAQVEAYESQMITKFENEKKEVVLTFQNVNNEYQNLLEQKKFLTSSLQSVKDSSNFFYIYEEYFNKTVNDAEMDALGKLEEIIIEQENFIENVKTEISNVDNHLLVLMQDLAKTSQDIDQIVNRIIIRSEVDDQINHLENMINSFSAGTTKTDDVKINIPQMPKKEAAKMEIPKFIPVEMNLAPRPTLTETVPNPVYMKMQAEHFHDTSHKRPKTVLIAENEKDTSAILNAVMEREGYQVHLAVDAYAVLNMIQNFEPVGIIILDSLLPYIETNSLIKQIRSSKKWCDVPIMITTSEQNKANSINFLESGANDFIEKPFNPREMAARANRLNQSLTQSCMRESS